MEKERDDKWEDVHLRVYRDDQYKGPGHKCISYKGVIYRPESKPQAGEVERAKQGLAHLALVATPSNETTQAVCDVLTALSTLDQQPQSGDVVDSITDEMLIQIITNAYMQATGSAPKPVKKVAADMLPWLRNSFDILLRQKLATLTEGKPDGVDVEHRLSPHDRLALARRVARYFAGYSFSRHEESQCVGLVDVLLNEGYKITPPKPTQGEK